MGIGFFLRLDAIFFDGVPVYRHADTRPIGNPAQGQRSLPRRWRNPRRKRKRAERHPNADGYRQATAGSELADPDLRWRNDEALGSREAQGALERLVTVVGHADLATLLGHRDTLAAELDVNPLSATGTGCVALDALVVPKAAIPAVSG